MAPPQKRTRRSGPDFSQICKSEIHKQLVKDNSVVTVYKRSGKAYSRRQLNWLLTNGLFPSRGNYVCDECLQYAKENMDRKEHDAAKTDVGGYNANTSDRIAPPSDDELSATTSHDPDNEDVIKSKVADIICLLREKEIKGQELSDLCLEVGKSLSSTIFNDSKTVMETYRDISQSSSIDSKQFLQDRPASIINLLCGMTMPQHINEVTLRKQYPFCLLLEQLYMVRNANFIGPCSFSQGLLKWTIHGSKIAHTIDGSTTASGSIRSLKRRFEECVSEKNHCFDSGDIDVFADNVQRVGKTTRVREGGTTPVNVATNVVFIQSNPPTSFQEDDQLTPARWFGITPTDSLAHQINDFEEDLKCSTFRPFRIQQQQELIKDVMNETTFENGILNDHVSVRICTTSLDKRVCTRCTSVINHCSTCPECNYITQNYPNRDVLYGGIPSKHKSTPSVKMGEIVDMNPNSILSIKALLHNLKEQAEVGENKKWVRVGFDGVPYVIASSIIDNTIVCNVCKQELHISKQSFSSHIEADHPDQVGEYTKVFDNVLLIPGAGHTEINLLRAIFSLCKYICVDHIAHRLGFRSKRATEFISRGSNHHITWQVFLIMYKAFALELAYEYYADCIRRDRVPSQKDWQIWRKNDVQNANYHLMYDIVHHYFMGLFCFRAGVRRNNSAYMVAGRQQVAPIFFIGRHRIYRKLIYRDMQTRIEAPIDIKAYIESNESFSKSGDDMRGQGGDYVTEEENRSLKSCLPPGVPTLPHWQWASRCNTLLQENRTNVFERVGVEDPSKNKISIFNFEEEVQCIRADIRQSGMLQHPRLEQPLVSLDGQPLHKDLVNMHMVITENYHNYKKSPNDWSGNPVFVTAEDERRYNDIHEWTKDAIARKTRELISNMVDEELSAYYWQVHKESASLTKPRLIAFYYEVEKALDDEKLDEEPAAIVEK